MGKLVYGPHLLQLEIEDRALAHLQVVILAKLRRSESFAFTWVPPREAGTGRAVIWLHPSQLLLFQFLGSRQPDINRQWVEELMTTANSGTGLRLTSEPDRPPSDRLEK